MKIALERYCQNWRETCCLQANSFYGCWPDLLTSSEIKSRQFINMEQNQIISTAMCPVKLHFVVEEEQIVLMVSVVYSCDSGSHVSKTQNLN